MTETFKLQNRRYLGNKYKLLDFIEEIVLQRCGMYSSFFDIFAGTGVVGHRFNRKNISVISNDFLYSNFVGLKTFLGTNKIDLKKLSEKIEFLNNVNPKSENYFSINFGNKYFTIDNANKIGAIREEIEKISDTPDEKYALITSLLYATDKVANTVGHYDAYREKLDTTNKLKLLVPEINTPINENNEIYCEDANSLINKVASDILYIDPPYNSRQYSDSYHLLENLAKWNKPPVYGKAKKMDRSDIKSDYSLKKAPDAFKDLILKANAKYVLVSYNNTGNTKDSRSNARISDEQIMDILSMKGKAHVFEKNYKAFTTGRSVTTNHYERLYFCEVK